MSSLVGWLILAIETIMAAPLWVVAHAMPEGEGFAGNHARQGYMLLLAVLIRPPLMVAGFFMSMVLIIGIGRLVGAGFLVYYSSVSADDVVGLPSVIAYIVILTSLMLTLTHRVFALITWLPDNVTRWVGQQLHNLGDAENERRMGHIFAAVGGKFEGGLGRQKRPTVRPGPGKAPGKDSQVTNQDLGGI